ncbi:MAG TPA: helix-turn-helix domain-containing protein, partial [Ktedonobacterales bacterium]
LRRLRVAASLTQEQLAERARVSARAISALERGVNRTPQRDTLRALIEALSLGERDRSALEATAHRGPLAHAPPEFATASEPGAFWQPGADAPPFVGRARELAAIARHLHGDGPPALLLSAEPGMGKTRLLCEAATRATAAAEACWPVAVSRGAARTPMLRCLAPSKRRCVVNRACNCARRWRAAAGWCACCPSLPTWTC